MSEQTDNYENDLLKATLGPITPWLDDRDVTDICVYGKDRIYCRRRGEGFTRVHASWQSTDDLITATKAIGDEMRRAINAREPILDARLPDKSRVNIIVAPCYDRGACVVIRKFPEQQFSLKDLASFGSIDENGVTILEIIVKMEKNILIAGGTGSGKTTLLNSLCGFIPKTDIVVTVEDAREISISNELWVPLESKRSMDAEDMEVTLRDLVRTSLRMNPRWVIVGEVRGAEALDLCRAFNTGHAGAGTIHSNSAYDALLALDGLVLQSGLDVPARAVKEMVSRAIHVVVHAGALPDHSRKLLEIIEVEGLDYDISAANPPYKTRTLYRYKFSHYDEAGKAVGRFHVCEPPSWINDLKMIPNFTTPDFWQQQQQQKEEKQ